MHMSVRQRTDDDATALDPLPARARFDQESIRDDMEGGGLPARLQARLRLQHERRLASERRTRPRPDTPDRRLAG